MAAKRKTPQIEEVVLRSEYRDILLARMAAGDLYASETLSIIRKIDMALDAIREKPIYGEKATEDQKLRVGKDGLIHHK